MLLILSVYLKTNINSWIISACYVCMLLASWTPMEILNLVIKIIKQQQDAKLVTDIVLLKYCMKMQFLYSAVEK